MESSSSGRFPASSSYDGPRGGDAHDEELLKELRAISNKSNRRFDDDDTPSPPVDTAVKDQPPLAAVEELNSSQMDDLRGSLVKGHQDGAFDDSNMTNISNPTESCKKSPSPPKVDASETTTGGFDKSNKFQGRNGGAAQDADLLDELMDISNKSSSPFFEEVGGQHCRDDCDGATSQNESASLNQTILATQKKERNFPPWKRSEKDNEDATSNVFERSIATPPSAAVMPFNESTIQIKIEKFGKYDEASAVTTDEASTSKPLTTHGEFQSNNSLPKTFKGDRGGAAEDAALLAELRAISNKSSARFQEEDSMVAAPDPLVENKRNKGSMENVCEAKAEQSLPPNPKTSSSPSQTLPPWKRKKSKKPAGTDDVEIVIAEPSAPCGVSAPIAAPPSDNQEVSTLDDDRQQESSIASFTEPTTALGSSDGQFQSNRSLPKTFHGDRGGAAEDAALLAELRAISNKSSARFQEEDSMVAAQDPLVEDNRNKGSIENVCEAKAEQNLRTDHVASSDLLTIQHSGDTAKYILPPSSSSSTAQFIVTQDNLNDSLKSSNWQLRKESYLFIHKLLESASSENGTTGELIEGEVVLPSLDGIIIQCLNEKNAGALDAALSLSIMYADVCVGASIDVTSRSIASALLKGTAFSSTRTSTMLLVERLVLKLIETGNSVSIQNILDAIQQHGINSRKPKAVLTSAKIVLRSVQDFGVGVFPVATLSAFSEVLITNTNNEVREVGLNISAELCRALGSKSPMQSIIDKMKPAQQSQLDNLLISQPSPTEPILHLRFRKENNVSLNSPGDILAAMREREEEEKAIKYSKRLAIDLFRELSQTSYKEKIKQEKWSEKVAALDALIKAGGEEPYKLLPPSPNVDYNPLVRQLAQLLKHTHFAVVSKALNSLAMIAEGVGEHIYPQLRPLIPELVGLFKDKKVVKTVASCLDKLFGNVLSFDHLLDSKDSLPSSLDEKLQKNALVRLSVLEYLTRCVSTNKPHGTRGQLTPDHAVKLCHLACNKLNDSDAAVRKAASGLLSSLINSNDTEVVLVTKESTSSLQSTNPRVFKLLHQATVNKSSFSDETASRPATAPPKPLPKNPEPTRPKSACPGQKVKTKNAEIPRHVDVEVMDVKLPSLDDAIKSLADLGIPRWSDDLENQGVLAGIRSTSWQKRMAALNDLTKYIEEHAMKFLNIVPSLFVLIRESTSSFKESNFNVAKAVLLLFNALFANVFKPHEKVPEAYLYTPATVIASEKLADRKLSEISALCLTSICVVKDPEKIVMLAMKHISSIKSPLAHEAFLGWFETFCVDFGAATLSGSLQDVVVWILGELDINNVKVKKAAVHSIGVLYSQLGPVLEAFVKSIATSTGKSSLIDKVFTEYKYDSAVRNVDRKLSCVTKSQADESDGSSRAQGAFLSVPATDLFALLGADFLKRVNNTEGKSSWKLRKEALEEVIQEASKCSGLISTEAKAYSSLKELLIALRSRLNDSQSNLKPLAATAMENILSRVDDASQAKFGRIVFPSLVVAAMTDMKKTMRDAAMSALQAGTRRSEISGGGINVVALEVLVLSLQSELSDAALKSTGLPELLSLLKDHIQSLTDLTENKKSLSTHDELAQIIVDCLLSSKAGIRTAGEKLLEVCAMKNTIPSDKFDTVISKLLPAQQRTVRSIIPKLSKEEKDYVGAFKKVRPRSSVSARQYSSQSSLRPILPNETATLERRPSRNIEKSNTRCVDNEIDPLAICRLDPILKRERLSAFGKGDNWPDFPEEPSGEVTHQTLRKSWSLLIENASVQSLLPRNGSNSMECYIEGCNLITRSINYSKSTGDSSIIEQLDLILKWAACALSSRDHTAGLRSILHVIFALFERLNDLSYKMNDIEALIILPILLDKAGTSKTPFQDMFLNIISFVTDNDIYSKKLYGSIICVKVIEKSLRSKSKSIAASQCGMCVQASALAAIGKKGLTVLSKAISTERLVENRVAYLNLFDLITRKLDGDLEKLFSLCGTSLSESAKVMIKERWSRQQTTSRHQKETSDGDNPAQSIKLRTPSKRNIPRFGESIPEVEASRSSILAQSSSAVATESLRMRLKTYTQSNRSLPLPPSKLSQSQLSSPSVTSSSSITELLQDIENKVLHVDSGSTTNSLVTNGRHSIEILYNVLSDDTSSFSSSEFNNCLNVLSRVIEHAFGRDGEFLPIELIGITVSALAGLTKMQRYIASISRETLVFVLGTIVNSLFDSRLDVAAKSNADNGLLKMINKLALRLATAPSRDISITALLSLQATVSSDDTIFCRRPKLTRVIEKLLGKVIKDESDTNPDAMFEGIDLESILTSLDNCLQAISHARTQRQGRGEFLKPADDMTRHLMLELLKHKKDNIRLSIRRLGLENESFLSLINSCEAELGRKRIPSDIENKSLVLASLINRVGDNDGEQRTAAVAELSKFRESNQDLFESHLSHLSIQFQEFIAEQLTKHVSKPAASVLDIEDRNQQICDVYQNAELCPEVQGQPSDVSVSISDLKARIEALKQDGY